MKTFVPVLALAAGVSATFHNAPPFSFPGNTDNKCTDKQKPGFSWDDLDFGDFFDYKDFNFRGWKCEDDGEKRSKFAPRTFGKAIGGTCFSEKQKSPSFGCGASVDRFSLGSIHVKPEFDCDLEFHYDMPDGSTCKHRSACRKSGTTVVNRQCGGAKNVTIIYPPQPHLPKPSCTIKVPTISFDCDTASSTKPPKTKTTKTPPATTAPPAEATTTPVVEQPSTTPSAGTPPSESSTSPAENTPPSETNTPGSSTSPAENTPPAQTSSVSPGQETSSVSPGQETSAVIVPPPVTKTITTSYDSTSTVFTTSIQTITSCAPTVPDCPANSVVTTVVTIAVSTTICPVTETLTTIEGVPTSSVQPGNGPSEGPSDGPSAVPSAVPSAGPSDGPSEGPSDGPGATSAPVPAITSTPVVGGTTGVVSSVSPVETLPCPGVVPSCLNTFLFNTGCSDNTDTACYCPDATFVKNIYDCLYAHGETDSIIAEAVAYFQGICGKWVSENPAIATDATVTTYITVTAQPTVAPVYTTVIVDVTTVVPCTDDAGEIIPSSSTTVTVSTSMTVPQIDFTTGSTGGVDMIPITAVPAVTEAPTPSAGGPGGPGVVITANGTAITVPTGTGSLIPSSTPTQSVVIAAGGRVGASFGLAAAVAFAAALVL
jgi:hypothetical protein